MILLNRSSRLLRRDLLADLVDRGFREVVSVETSERSYTVESLSREFPQARFILTEGSVTIGEAINLANHYVHSEYALVLWSTMGVPQNLEKGVELLQNRPARVCVAPLLRGERGEALPTVQAPALHRKALRIIPIPLRGDGGFTIFPYDSAAVYHGEPFRRVGGYDPRIPHPFWQKLDFGFRIHLWGGDIPVAPTMRISYKSMPEPEDQTINESYARFYAKSLAVKLTSQGAAIPPLAALGFALRSGIGFSAAIRLFQDAKVWVAAHQHSFRVDPRDLVERWSVDHE